MPGSAKSPLGFPSILGGSSRPAHPVRSRAGCLSRELRKISRRAWPRCSSRTRVSVREPAAPGARCRIGPKSQRSPSPTLSSPSLVSAEADSYQGPEMSRELDRLILCLRAPHSPRLLDSQNPGQRHRTLQGCGGKRDRSRRPFWGSVLRSNGTRPAGTQALGD